MQRCRSPAVVFWTSCGLESPEPQGFLSLAARGQLLWTSTKANRASRGPPRASQGFPLSISTLRTITISFDILESLPDLVVAPDQQIDEILITLPRGFIHRVEKTTDLQLMNENMPLREVDYLDYFQKARQSCGFLGNHVKGD